MGTANNVLNRIKKARVIRARIDKWDWKASLEERNNIRNGSKFIWQGINIQNIHGSKKLNSKGQIIQLKMCKWTEKSPQMKRHKWAMKAWTKLPLRKCKSKGHWDSIKHQSEWWWSGNNKCWRGCVELESFHTVAGI
jgi:hypothetical protein